MKIEYINPFIQASQSIIVQTTGFTTSIGKVYIKNRPYKGNEVVVLIGLTGEIQGSTTISMNNILACKIAAAMMGVASIPVLDEIAKSAIAELGNMILGNAAGIFSKNKINIDITPPIVFTGENIELSISNSVIICIPLVFVDGKCLEIDLTYIEKAAIGQKK